MAAASPSVLDEDELRLEYQHMKNRYDDLIYYVTEGRQQRIQQRDEILRRVAAIEDSISMIQPEHRMTIAPMVEEQRSMAATLESHINTLDFAREGERQWIIDQFLWLLTNEIAI